jgi:hypothetical protein
MHVYAFCITMHGETILRAPRTHIAFKPKPELQFYTCDKKNLKAQNQKIGGFFFFFLGIGEGNGRFFELINHLRP